MGNTNLAGPEGSRSRAVLWDLDGTLADSKTYHWRAWQRAMGDEGLTLTEEKFLASFGQRNDTILGDWLGPDPDPDQVVRVGDAKEAFYRELVRTEGITPLPTALKWDAGPGT